METSKTVENIETPIKKGRGQYERKARGGYKNNADKKISVKHFINTSLKPNNDIYPVYVRVSVKSQTTQIPCEHIKKYELNQELEKPEIKEYLEKDKKIIEWIIDKLKPFDRSDFLIKEFTEIYKLLNYSVSYIVEEFLLKEISEAENAKQLFSIFHEISLPYQFGSYKHKERVIDIMPDYIETKNRRGIFIGMGKVEEYVSDIWGLYCYEDLFRIRAKVKKMNYSPEINMYQPDSIIYAEMRLIEFLNGEYQQRLIEEFGSSIMQPIFDDIYKLFKRNMVQFNLLFK
jgi:hypothetical protein